MNTPIQPTEPVSFTGFLCRAWGETDLPCAEVVADLEGVSRFMVREWLGDKDATNFDGSLTLPNIMEELSNRDWAEYGDWSAEFEIGGVSVEPVYSFAAQHPTEHAKANLGELAFSFISFDDWVNRASTIWRQHGLTSRHTLCVDQKGRVCAWGLHFQIARDEGAFPVDVYRLRTDMAPATSQHHPV